MAEQRAVIVTLKAQLEEQTKARADFYDTMREDLAASRDAAPVEGISGDDFFQLKFAADEISLVLVWSTSRNRLRKRFE
jgi:hypothetical protein